MKSHKTTYLSVLLTALAFTFSISACQQIKNEINEATTTYVTTDLIFPVTAIEASHQSGDISFQHEETYSIVANEEINQYLQNISDIDIVGIQIKVTEATPENMILKNASFFLHEPGSNDVFTCSTPNNFPIATNSEFTISENEANWGLVNSMVDKLGDIYLSCEGTVSCESEKTTLSLQFIIKVRAAISADL